jgi:hypothetical protein
MNCAETAFFNMAMESLRIAIERLRQLLDEQTFPRAARRYEWTRSVCGYTRCVHTEVWRDHIAKDQVKTDIIPLLHRAEEDVRSVYQRSDLGQEEKNAIGDIVANIRLRAGNLDQRYLNDLDSCFPVDAIEPRLVLSE